MVRRALEEGLSLYLRQISRVPLLSPREEIELGWRIINDEDPDAKERMIRANLRLVVAIARSRVRPDLPLVDVIAEGNVGLIRAVELWDPARGTRFSTYAAWWIKQAIGQAGIRSMATVYVPTYLVQLVGKWKRAAHGLETELDRAPTAAEVSARMRVPSKRAPRICAAVAALRQPKRVPAPDDGELTHCPDVFVDRSRPEDQVVRREQIQAMRRILAELCPTQARVVRLRFGLEGRAPLTLEEIGNEVGVTREAVRKIEKRALEHIRRRLQSASHAA